jgi:hypothetical protein
MKILIPSQYGHILKLWILKSRENNVVEHNMFNESVPFIMVIVYLVNSHYQVGMNPQHKMIVKFW